jgi:hypothetical protein
MATSDFIPSGLTTGIGSLPHHNIDAALAFSFRFKIPFLPQIPIRNPWEYSIPQGLEGLPGLRIEPDGSPYLDYGVWLGRSKAFEERLGLAFGASLGKASFEGFEPSSATSSSWQPFLWELSERATQVAKVQIVGPLTAQWSLRTTEGKRLDNDLEVSHQVFRLILARAIGMCRRLLSIGVKPLLFLDEPALFVLSNQSPSHQVALRELALVVSALQKEGASVGLHCCSNTEWASVMELGLDFLSIDSTLSLASVLAEEAAVAAFLDRGGRFAMGVVPTSVPNGIESLDLNALREVLALGTHDSRVFGKALWTPACGLALHTPKDADTVFALLAEFSESVL